MTLEQWCRQESCKEDIWWCKQITTKNDVLCIQNYIPPLETPIDAEIGVIICTLKISAKNVMGKIKFLFSSSL